MAKLEKLKIMGLRSFGPNEEDACSIEFISPVTLFLGQNGCGKTTIIEALKFACSGDLPPGCTKGGGFVHDPKLANRAEVRGQVKLKIQTINGDSVTVLKPIQATQKAKKCEFKRLDFVLTRTKPNGDSKNFSSRCAEINVEFALELGVSNSILNNVIFCHQEESNWPLDEPKKVKERFDAIFDATKYNKCLEHMRNIRKGKQNKQKLFKEQVNAAEEHLAEVKKKKHKLKEDERQVRNLTEIIDEYKERRNPMVIRIKEIDSLLLNYDSLRNDLNVKKKEVENLRGYRLEIEKSVDIVNDSDTEIEKYINQFSLEMKLRKKKLHDCENEITAKTKEEKELSDKISAEHLKIGRFEQEVNANEKLIEQQKKILKALATDLSIDSTISGKEIIYNADLELCEKKRFKEYFTKEAESTEIELQNTICNERENKAKLIQDIDSHIKQLSTLRIDIRKIKRSLDEADASSNHLIELDKKITSNERDLASLSTKFDSDAISKEIDDAVSERDSLEKQLDRVDKEINRLTILSKVQTELDLEQTALNCVESEIRAFKNKYEDSLIQLLNEEVADESLAERFWNCEKQFKHEFEQLASSVAILEKKIVNIESRKLHTSQRLAEEENVLKSDIKQVTEMCCGKSYEIMLQEIKENIEKLQDEKGLLTDSSYVFKSFRNKLKEDEPCCPVCHRDFNNKPRSFVQEIIEEIDAKLKINPAQLKAVESQLDLLQQKYNNMLKLDPIIVNIQKVRNEIVPEMQKNIKEAEKELEVANNELEMLTSELSLSKDNLKMATDLSNKIVLFEQRRNQIPKHKRRIDELKAQISSGSSGRTLTEAQHDQKQLKIKVTDNRRQIDSLQKQFNIFNEEKQALRELGNKLTAERLRIQKNAQEAAQLRDRLAEFRSKETQLDVELAEREKLKEPLEQKIINLNNDLKNLRQKNKNIIEKTTNDIHKLRKHIEEVDKLQSVIDKFCKEGIEEQLKLSNDTLSTLEIYKKQCLDFKVKLSFELDSIKSFLNNQENVIKNFQQNLKLRERIKEEHVLNEKIKNLTEMLEKSDDETIRKEKSDLNKDLGKLSTKIYQTEGRKSELEKNIADIKNELAEESYANAESRYKCKSYEMRINEKIVHDLGNFVEAMDVAMKNFHKERMVQVNRSVRELWRDVYKGNDIDYIEIRTDESPTVRDGRRSFNYRVIQVKNGIELDMRGRCSAGQRVLASLIIRIALAETFSSNCGILALDEPTTNLDRLNIGSLSQSLAEIVERKKSQKNFQMIIITHDKVFLEALALRDRIEEFYLVSRNNSGKSVVKKSQFDY